MSPCIYGKCYYLTHHIVMDISNFLGSGYSESDFRLRCGPAGIKSSTTGYLQSHKQINPLSLH